MTGSDWSQALEAGDTVTFSQRRGPATLMLSGAVMLLAVEILATGLLDGANAWRSPGLLMVTLVTLLIFVPVPLWRVMTGGPRLYVTSDGVRYGRFAVGWSEVGKVRLVNGGTRVEVGARGESRSFPLDNRLVSELMRRGVRAQGSWLSGWMNVNESALAEWLERERRARQGPSPR